jgi:hypothetical protein
MLVCNVSRRARRAAVAAAIAETASALDAATTGNVVFATLVDDPASVRDSVDAYLGEIMLEAASAAAVVNAGLVYAVVVAEAVTAADVPSATVPAILSATITEAAAAADAPDATVGAAAMRSTMLMGLVALNSSTSREAFVDGIMVNS